MSKFIDKIKAFFGPAATAISGYLNLAELAKAVVLGLVTGGGIYGVLAQVQANAVTVFPSPADDALVAAVLAFLLDATRRLPQGRKVQIPR